MSEYSKRNRDWHCQIVRIERGSDIDDLIARYQREQALFAHRPKVCRAQAIRELLRLLVKRKKHNLAEPEQLGLFSELQNSSLVHRK